MQRNSSTLLKGCGMGPWLVLVSPCFRKNVVATCKIGSFLCSLDNLLQKYVVVFFFGNQTANWRSFAIKGYFRPNFQIGKSASCVELRQKVLRVYIGTYIRTRHFAQYERTLSAVPILKKSTNLSVRLSVVV